MFLKYLQLDRKRIKSRRRRENWASLANKPENLIDNWQKFNEYH